MSIKVIRNLLQIIKIINVNKTFKDILKSILENFVKYFGNINNKFTKIFSHKV